MSKKDIDKNILYSVLNPTQDFKHRMNFYVLESCVDYFKQEQSKHALEQKEICIKYNFDDSIFITEEAKNYIDNVLIWFNENVFNKKIDNFMQLSQALENDMIIIRPYQDTYKIIAASVCFPSNWDVGEKVGLTINESHMIVPKLNEQLQDKINKGLKLISDNKSYKRYNLGLAASNVLNQHPKLNSVKRLGASEINSLNDVYYRLEEQVFMKIPNTDGILFNIKIITDTIESISDDYELILGLKKWLETMDVNIAEYKSLKSSKQKIIDLLHE